MEERKKEIKLNENDARNSNRIRRRPTNIGHFRYQNRMPMRQRSEHIGCSVCCVRRQWPHEWKGKKSRHFLCHLSRDTFKIHYRRTLYRIINYVYVERASRSKLYTFALNRPPPSTSRTHTYIVIGVAQKPTTATERKIKKNENENRRHKNNLCFCVHHHQWQQRTHVTAIRAMRGQHEWNKKNPNKYKYKNINKRKPFGARTTLLMMIWLSLRSPDSFGLKTMA